jgi:hypothetical protein
MRASATAKARTPRRRTNLFRGVHGSTAVQQQTRDLNVAVLRSPVQRRASVLCASAAACVRARRHATSACMTRYRYHGAASTRGNTRR